jgi:hypothetical protein
VNKFKTKYLPYFPIFGIALYIIIFTFAASQYPGGSTNYPHSNGYSFFNNLLCDAMDPITKNGSINSARFIAVISHLILSFTMISFFYILPKMFLIENRNTKLMSFFGRITMTIFIFMSTEYHDLIVTITGVLGTIALIPLFIELQYYKNKNMKHLVYLCYTLSVIVFLIFETKIGIYYLPIIQKITFAADALWVVWTCIIVINKNKTALLAQ